MAKKALLLASLLCVIRVFPEASELQRTMCNREDDGRGPDASILVTARKREDEATIEFELYNFSFSFTLQARSAFAANGAVRTVSATGSESVNPHNQQAQSYRLWEGSRHARAVISHGGKVRGLFSTGPVSVYLGPADSNGDQLEEGVLHHLYILQGSNLLVQASNSSAASNPSLHGGVQQSSATNIFESDGSTDPSWAGDRFYPGCYPDDDNMHSMKLRIYTDVQLYTENPGE
eukprot:791966-Amphidinium_carterae.1